MKRPANRPMESRLVDGHRGDTLRQHLEERILFLDGAMGTMIQRYDLDEAGYRGERFADWEHDLKGNNDLLSLSQPWIIEEIHTAYLEAGADIVETNTFNANAISMADYGMESLVYELNRASAALARKAADVAGAADGSVRFVSGVLGPTNRTASISPDVNDPAFRNVTFEELTAAYREAARGLMDGGSDIILVETVFDTLNAKAALYAIDREFEVRGTRLPVMISGTITDASGRTLTGQTPTAFWNSVRHARPVSVGLNCALGAEEMRPHVGELSQIAETHVSAHPNAGLPNEFGQYDESPEHMSAVVSEFAESGFVNILGGCCGTTPEHIRAIVDACKGLATRAIPTPTRACRLSGLEPCAIDDQSLFVNIGERTNVTGSARFRRLIKDGDFVAGLEVARSQVENGAQIVDVNMDEGMLDSEQAMRRFLNLLAAEPDIARVPVMIDSSKWSVLESGLKCVQGKPVVNSISLKEGEEEFLRHAREVRRYGAAVVVMAFDEEGQADSVERKVDICARCYSLLTEEVGFPPEDIIFDPNIFAIATGIEEHNDYAVAFIEATRAIKSGYPAPWYPEVYQCLVLVSRQRCRPRSDSLGVSLPCHPGGHGHGNRQRGAVGGVRGHPRGPPRASGRCRSQPSPGCHGTLARDCSNSTAAARRRAAARKISPGVSGRWKREWSTRWLRESTNLSSRIRSRRGSGPSALSMSSRAP